MNPEHALLNTSIDQLSDDALDRICDDCQLAHKYWFKVCDSLLVLLRIGRVDCVLDEKDLKAVVRHSFEFKGQLYNSDKLDREPLAISYSCGAAVPFSWPPRSIHHKRAMAATKKVWDRTAFGRSIPVDDARAITRYVVEMNDTPPLSEVLSCLYMDASSASESFAEWCSNMGADTDSRKALDSYLQCQNIRDWLFANVPNYSRMAALANSL